MNYTLIAIGIILASWVCLFSIHESAHYVVYKTHNLNATIHLDAIPPYTSAEGTCNDSCKLGNNIVDAIGYHLLPFFLLACFAVLFLAMILDCLLDKQKEDLYIDEG